MINVYIISERRSLFSPSSSSLIFFNIAPLTCAFELTSSNSYFNSYCKHLSLRSTLSKYLENLDYLLIDLHQFSREKWISLFEVGSKPSNKKCSIFYKPCISYNKICARGETSVYFTLIDGFQQLISSCFTPLKHRWEISKFQRLRCPKG